MKKIAYFVVLALLLFIWTGSALADDGWSSFGGGGGYVNTWTGGGGQTTDTTPTNPPEEPALPTYLDLSTYVPSLLDRTPTGGNIWDIREADLGYCPLQNGYGWYGGLRWPVDSRLVKTQRAFRNGHTAIDIDVPFNSPVYAATSGTVVWAGWNVRGYGNLVVLAHGGTWQTVYAHFNTVAVVCGQWVSQGQIIGTSGTTGATSFDHLHFEVRYQGRALDPLRYLSR